MGPDHTIINYDIRNISSGSVYAIASPFFSRFYRQNASNSNNIIKHNLALNLRYVGFQIQVKLSKTAQKAA
jgi:hypothetical protein